MFVKELQRACTEIGLNLKVVPYQLRHSGASIDKSRDCRTLKEIMKRGRWRSMKSLVRYEKHSRLADFFVKMTTAVQNRCRAAETRIEGIVLGALRRARGRTLA